MTATRAGSAPRKVSERRPSPDPDQREASESELTLAWFRLLARCRGAWLQTLWMNDGSIDGRATVTHAELAGILADHDSPEAEAAWARSQETVGVWRAELREVEARIAALEDSRFGRLARIFGLAAEESDLLRLCAAVAFDPALGRVCAYLQDHSGRAYVTEELAFRLLGLGRTGVWTPDMNLFRWELVERHDTGVGEPGALVCDPQIREWLLGRDSLDAVLVGAAKLAEALPDALPEWPVGEVASWVDRSLRHSEPAPIRLIVAAPRGGGKRTFAGAVAQKLGMPLLVLDGATVDDLRWRRFFLHSQRQVFLNTAVPAWVGGAALRPWPSNQALFPIQFVLCEPDVDPPSAAGAIDRRVELPMPDADARERLWRRSSAVAARWPKKELRRLAEHHRVWPGDIERAARLGAATPMEAALRVREEARSRFGGLAQILECPFTADDLVLPEGAKQLLEAIAFEAEERSVFWRQAEPRRLFPQGRGLIALFSGPSGTGKTMAAQVIAARLAQDLCRVNIAQLVSKWVGDTPKNVERVVRVAAENNVVLFFDEADALFAKRAAEIRDAQDKFANTDTAFLLQAIEGYPGIAILATNLKTNIDPAFLRRLRYLVEFPKPDAELRRVLWTKLVGALAGESRVQTLASAAEFLGAAIEATGAQIKLAVLAAVFAARADDEPLSAKHLLTGLDRELAKEGRAVGPRERERLLKLGEK